MNLNCNQMEFYFNSTIVRLRGVENPANGSEYIYFNSTIVRLRAVRRLIKIRFRFISIQLLYD